MKKTLLTTAVAAMAMLAGCQHSEEKKTTENTTTAEDTAVQEVEITSIEVEESASDIHFMEAINRFKEKENEAAAMHIEKGIKAYKQETAHAVGKIKTTAEANITALQTLAEKVKKNEVKDVAELENEFDKAERIVAHTIVYSVDDVVLVPDSISQSESYFSKALAHFKTVVSKEKSTSKKTGEDIAAKGDEIEAKLKHKEKVASKDIKEFYTKSRKWLEDRF